MELFPGIAVHFIQSKKFKTNKITMRFTAPLSLDLISGRMLSASMLETANKGYPTAQVLRKHLAALYGADLSTHAYRRGQSHLVDVSLTYVRDEFLSKKNVLTAQILELLYQVIFNPLSNEDEFENNAFEIEKKQLLARLESELEDPFFFAHKELDQLFFQEESMQLVPKDLIAPPLCITPRSFKRDWRVINSSNNLYSIVHLNLWYYTIFYLEMAEVNLLEMKAILILKGVKRTRKFSLFMV